MPIPALDQHGLLPVGEHLCTWAEIEATYCWNPLRSQIFDGLRDFFAQVWLPLNIQAPFWVDGSFTRKTDTPGDIDLVADLMHLDAPAAWPAIQVWFNHDQLKDTYKVDFWFKHPIYPHDLSAFFCYTGLKAAAELGLDSKHPKGILRVLP